ncbi:MAG: GNAT family N-acetyltransferase [Vicinamibacterales bacterium]
MAKRHVAPIVSGRIRLRLLQEADLPMTMAWRNQEGIRQWFFTSHPITKEEHRRWFNQYSQRDDDFVFVIEETETFHKPVGQAAIYRVDWAGGSAEFGRMMIGEPVAKRQGLARLATDTLTSYALHTWRLREVDLKVRSTNVAAVALYQRCGFLTTDQQGDVVHMRRTAEAGDRR